METDCKKKQKIRKTLFSFKEKSVLLKCLVYLFWAWIPQGRIFRSPLFPSSRMPLRSVLDPPGSSPALPPPYIPSSTVVQHQYPEHGLQMNKLHINSFTSIYYLHKILLLCSCYFYFLRISCVLYLDCVYYEFYYFHHFLQMYQMQHYKY